MDQGEKLMDQVQGSIRLIKKQEVKKKSTTWSDVKVQEAHLRENQKREWT